MNYYYLCCHSCQRKQYIGAELLEAQKAVQTAMASQADAATVTQILTGVGSSLVLALKFIRLHQTHQLGLYRTCEDNMAIDGYEEEWPYDAKHNEFLTPTFDSIKPLGRMELEAKLEREILEWKRAFQQVRMVLYDYQINDEKNTNNERMRLQRELREFVEKEVQGILKGANAVEFDDIVDLPPPPEKTAREKFIEDLAAGMRAEDYK